jgi:hypothetical protein
MAVSKELRRRLTACVRAYRAEMGEKVDFCKRFDQIEDEACEVGDDLSAALIEELLAEQAATSSRGELACCPRCQRPGRPEEPEPRVVQTRRGDVAWQEPKYYCRHCRQAFFPSVENSGGGRGPNRQSGRTAEDRV